MKYFLTFQKLSDSNRERERVDVFIDDIISNSCNNSPLLPLEDSSCSLVTCQRALETLPDPKILAELLHDIVRVCANGARIDISARHPWNSDFIDDPYCRLHLTHQGLQALLQDSPCPELIQVKADMNLDPRFSAQIQTLKLDNNALVQRAKSTPGSIRTTNWSFIVEKAQKDHVYLDCLTHVPDVAPYPFKIYRKYKPIRLISLTVAQTGIWEGVETILVSKLLKALRSKLDRPLRFFNAGANIGWYSALALHCVSDIELTAFEPVSSTFELLSKNAVAGEGQKVTLHHMALSDRDGEDKIFLSVGSLGCSSLGMRNPEDAENFELVQLRKLDSLYPHDQADSLCDFLMMDIEGAEHKFFNGAAGLLQNGFRPIICMEFNPLLLKAQGSDGSYVKDLENLGYSFYLITNQPSGILNNKISTQSILESYRNINHQKVENLLNLLAVPEHIDLAALIG